MIISSQVMVLAGTTIILATTEKIADLYGLERVRKITKVIIPILGIATAVYFLEFNSITKWLGL